MAQVARPSHRPSPGRLLTRSRVDDTTGTVRRARSPRRFWIWLAVWSLVGLGIRLGTVYGRFGRKPGGDPAYFHSAANLLVGGHGFINPWLYPAHSVQTASWPPLFVFLLAIPAALGFHGFLASRIWSCVIGMAGVAMVGIAGREIAGRRVGLVAALLAAVYPNIWTNDELAAVETLAPLLVGLILWAAYRFWRQPSSARMVVLGLSIGVAALGRDEMVLMAAFILVPIALLARRFAWRRRLLLVLVGLVATGFVVVPWVSYNMTRFEDPVFISSGLGVTLASANCDQTYFGPEEGYWSFQCALKAPHDPTADESVTSTADREYALRYIRHHEDRLVPVVLARLGRGFGFFHPLEQIHLDSYVETRPYHWALVGLGMYYVLLVLAAGGALLLRRRRIPSFPLWAVGLDVVLSMIIAFGQTRYRQNFEICLVLLAAVQIEWAWGAVGRRLRGQVPPVDGETVPAGSPEPAAAPT